MSKQDIIRFIGSLFLAGLALTYYPKEVSFLKRVKDDSLAAGGR
ncbi:hypothetical protein ABE083_13930 [Bacillus mycoides]|nr:hypothetical protein [Bacillus mycoides]